MTTAYLYLFLLLGLPACGGPAAPMADWWTVETGYTGPQQLSSIDTDTTEDTGAGDDNARELRGSLQQGNMSATVELRYYLAIDGVVWCDVVYGSAAIAPLDTCTPCVAAFQLTLSDEDVRTDRDGTCASEGWSGKEGTPLLLGLDATTAYWDIGEGWMAAGTAAPNNNGFSVTIPL